MSAGDLVLAIDIGTGATKAVLFDAQLKPVAILRKHYPLLAPAKGWSEQEPEVIFQAVLAALHESFAAAPPGSRIRGVAFSSQLYSVLALGPEGQVLSNSLTWSDTRSHQEAQALRQCPQASEIIQRTGCPIDAAYPLAKIKWLKDNLSLPPEARFVSIKEYVLQRLTGQFLADWAIASATGMFDIRLQRWDPEATALLGITAENLSSLVSPRTVLETWSQEARDLAGIPPGTPLVVGGGDGQLASLGVGAATSDALAVNVGTSAAARALIRQPAVDPGGRLWTYVADEKLWAIGGMVSSGGIVFEWFLNNFFTTPDATRGERDQPGDICVCRPDCFSSPTGSRRPAVYPLPERCSSPRLAAEYAGQLQRDRPHSPARAFCPGSVGRHHALDLPDRREHRVRAGQAFRGDLCHGWADRLSSLAADRCRYVRCGRSRPGDIRGFGARRSDAGDDRPGDEI